jgi:hypothetical protein
VIGPAISDILPLALGVMISPVPIIAVIVMLFTPRATANGLSFLAGWVIGLAIVSAVVYVIADGADVGSDSSASDGASTVKLVIGVALVLLAVRQWRNRPRSGETPPMPKWMHAIDAVTPVRAIGLGILLSAINPKNLLLTVAAATAVAQVAGLSTADAVVTLAVFVLVASLSIAVPVVVVLVAGDRAQRVLDAWKVWLEQNNATVMTVLLLVIGVVVFSKGLGPITM